MWEVSSSGSLTTTESVGTKCYMEHLMNSWEQPQESMEATNIFPHHLVNCYYGKGPIL